ncbi:MAG: FtsX-like permease family protein [Gemmatimonadetes bacterium]|nr:FtsX-like permease family protein [Gemmatimonadota bacterium]NIO32992.1 FtsX-like permease family protein [Gemmatimonadota bacterium]
MDTLLSDLRYAVRRLSQRPGFAAIALLTMALGIGANSAIFSIVNAVLLRPLPVESPDRLVEIYSQEADDDVPVTQAYPDYLDIRARDDLFSGVTAYTADFFSVNLGTRSEVMFGESVTGDYFDVLGVPAAVGRTFISGEDDAVGAPPVVVISHGLWKRRFASDPRVLGQTLRIRGRPFEIVGVSPPEFKGLLMGFSAELWIPLSANASFAAAGAMLDDRDSRYLLIKGRLRPGVTAEQAQAGLNVLAGQLAEAYPDSNEGRRFPVIPTNDVRLHPMIDRALVPVAALLMTVVGLLLLIVCTNLANLLLARALARRKEIAIRLAMGAGRWRLVRQLLTESVLLGLLGGALGLAVAWWTAKLLVSFQPPVLFKLSLDIGIDGRVLVFTFFVSLVAAMFFGLAPALQATRPQLVQALKDELDTVAQRFRRFGLRGSLVIVQVAVSLVLLVGAGLFLRSLIGAQAIDPGFERERAAILMIAPELAGYDETRAENLLFELRDRARTVPGVETVSLASHLPLGVSVNATALYVEGAETRPDDAPSIDITVVSSGHFETMGIPLLRGRDFNDRDDDSATPVVILSEAAARRFWPGDNPVGKRLRLGASDGELREIIAVAQDTKVRTLGEEPRPYLYLPFSQNYRPIMSLVVRTSGDPRSILPVLLRESLLLDESLPIMESKTMEQHLGIMLFAPRMGGILLGVFGGLAVLLATIGLYGVVSYAAAQRTREVGIRVALGARPRDVIRLVTGQGMALVGIGAAIGLALGFAAAQPLGSFLYGVNVSDPTTFLGVTLLLVGVAFLATLVPALRAARLDAMVALRRE